MHLSLVSAGAQQRGKLWVLDGRIYNYPKPGAQEVGSQVEANQVLQAGLEAAKVSWLAHW